MRVKSEIFEEYEKIAEKHGLVSEGQVREPKVRYDSRQLSDIALLYGVQPEGTEESVIDKAHPETVVIAPAYDAMNAVVENLRERQDIMSWIALKVPDGHITHHRYVAAYKELLDSVIKVGFITDNNDELELMKLADSCAERLHKEAVAPLVIGLGVAALLGIGYYFTQMPVSVQNVQANAELVLNRIPEDASYKTDLTALVNEIKGLGNQLNDLHAPMSQMFRDLKAAVNNGDLETAQNMVVTFEPQKKVAAELIVAMNEKKNNLNTYKIDATNEPDKSQKHWDWWQKVLEVRDYIYQSDEESLPGAIDALMKAIDELVGGLKSVMAGFAQYSGQIQQKLLPKKQTAEEILNLEPATT